MPDSKIIEFPLQTEYIHLIQLLKVTDLVASGGEAQMVVVEGLVQYNGAVDYRKRLKVRVGDTVTFDMQTIRVVAHAADEAIV